MAHHILKAKEVFINSGMTKKAFSPYTPKGLFRAVEMCLQIMTKRNLTGINWSKTVDFEGVLCYTELCVTMG